MARKNHKKRKGKRVSKKQRVKAAGLLAKRKRARKKADDLPTFEVFPPADDPGWTPERAPGDRTIVSGT
jgi:hypothetical protein